MKNYGADDFVKQEPHEIDPSRVSPEDFPIAYEVHKREDASNKSKFTGHGAKVNFRPLKGEHAGSGVFSREAGKRTKK